MHHRCVTGFYLPFLVFLLCISLPAFSQDRIRIGLSSVSATSGSIWVAEEKNLFKKHGIDAEVIIIGGGAADRKLNLAGDQRAHHAGTTGTVERLKQLELLEH